MEILPCKTDSQVPPSCHPEPQAKDLVSGRGVCQARSPDPSLRFASLRMTHAGETARIRMRKWLGLLTMLSIADATHDPLIHEDSDLVDSLAGIFESAAGRLP